MRNLLGIYCAVFFVVGGSTVALTQGQVPPHEPEERLDENSRTAHRQHVEKSKTGKIDVYFVGDSITRRWGATDYPEFLEHWRKSFFGWNAANFGWGGDRTQNILWRLKHGELDGLEPKVFVILAGTNNLHPNMSDEQIERVAGGVAAIVDCCQSKVPKATIILMSIFPRSDIPDGPKIVRKLNRLLQTMAEEREIVWLDVQRELSDEQGEARRDLFPDRLHPSLAGYQVWADALRPLLEKHLGPPSDEDHAPPPTGDPRTASR